MVRLALLPALAAALPHHPDLIESIENADLSDEGGICLLGPCRKPTDMQYELLFNTQPGVQWMTYGGYCGSWSIQRAAMAKGAWISQQQVRDHALPGGGNDEEILAPNIDDALVKLKIKAEGWDYANQPTPQLDGYLKFLKKKLVAGHAIVWMIMQPGEKVPITQSPYNLTEVNGLYGHIEPVVGIMSNHPLSDETVYDDDVFVHYTDADKNTYYRTVESLPSDWSEAHPYPSCSNTMYSGAPCINKQRGYGWAIEGFLDDHEGMPLSLTLDHWASEPSPRAGKEAIQLTGTLTATALTPGSEYTIYRWDSVDEAFVYSDDKKIHTFTATDDTFVFQDPNTFSSFSATYYRCVSTSVGRMVV
jgi:hypothetical protein